MIFKSTKVFDNLPCSHQQWQDADDSGIPGTGHCSKTHGYSRSVHFEFSCTEVDDYGWVVGFSSLKRVKSWLEYMFDHTSLWEAGDPRLSKVLAFNESLDVPVYNVRVLPTGVSMEQSALFLALHLNPFIIHTTNGRCWISRIEVRENTKNSGIIEMDKDDALKMSVWLNAACDDDFFPTKTQYNYIAPKKLINEIGDIRLCRSV